MILFGCVAIPINYVINASGTHLNVKSYSLVKEVNCY